MNISLIISTYNSPDILDKILEIIALGTKIPDEILIADDGSSKKTAKMLQKWQEILPVKHIWHEDKGFRKCKILNKTLKAVNNGYVIFLDGDCIPHIRFIEDHYKLAEKGFFIQGRRCFVSQSEVPNFLSGSKSLSRLFFTGKLSGYFKSVRFPKPIIKIDQGQRGLIGCNWAAWHTDLININGFDQSYEGWGIGEDSDICTRLYNIGIKRKFVYGRAVVYHLNHPELPKNHHADSKRKLLDVIETGKTRCVNGLNYDPESK